MPFADPTTPSLADFLVFLNEEVQLPSDALATSSPWPSYAYNQAIALIPVGAVIPSILYILAIYNLATHLLFKITPDNAAASPPDNTYFSDKRKAFGLTGGGGAAGILGIATSASDQGTAGSIALPSWWETLTLSALDLLRTPWGQWAFAYMQDYGPSVYGLS